ncbi:ABC transporter substrate-binding protein [Candidatus Entotheonella palauensis]|uniref:Solute-binding protein family 5 domain-containing protein n=1 Tax=Candidatus Entotheonella gemina TaxID=1429439 RepID=W4LNG0_9BACT|nr:ABC transporter substrate-binding protein [Candidatus Entotheonella palauensis]ETW98911.1 MAG: hypothetical protein ETSY2_41965 [Candidatus Entotheonella gemina]
MSRAMHLPETELSRREFLAGTSGALAGAAAFGLAGKAEAGKKHPTRGGELRFGMRSDSIALDPHRNVMYLTSHPLGATTQGLLDLDLKCRPVPGIAYDWDVSKDLMTYTFKMIKGASFHNGREIDAAAVKWNYERIKDPKIGHFFTRSALENLKEVQVVDKYTVRCNLHHPDVTFPANVVYYPCNLMAPGSEDQADTHPIGCGPFKFKKWDRYEVTILKRYENYFETDAEGNNLPYLDTFVGRPKQDDRVRLTALRTGQVDLIDNMAYADAADFPSKYADQFQTWDVPTLGTSFLTFNLEKGPFSYSNPDGKKLRQAAAHAVDHEAIHNAVFYKRGDLAYGYFAKVSPWHAPGKPWPEFDPEKSKSILQKAKAIGTPITLYSPKSWPYMQQTGELVHAMWTAAGFKVNFEILDGAVFRPKMRSGDFDALSMAGAYRFDPDGWFSRQIHSEGSTTKNTSRFRNEKVDSLIAEAKATVDINKRLEMYTEVESIINEELPILYIHHLTLLEAGVKNIMGYQPAVSGAYCTKGGGLRATWLA